MVGNPTLAPPQRPRTGHIGQIIMWGISTGLLMLVIVALVIRFTTPVQIFRLRAIQDIPLPSALPDPNRTTQNPLAPGLAVRFDHFDFQALDPQTHLLFINHSGPAPDDLNTVNIQVNPLDDGNVIVFNTVQNKVVKLLRIPQTSGITLASDIHWMYDSDAQDGIIYGVDESTFKTVQIKLDPNDAPDASAYDPVDHRLFVSDPGGPISDSNQNIALKNQNVAVIDVLHNTLITKIPLGVDKPFGDDVGHIQYDPTSHRVYVVTLPLSDQNILPNPPVNPPYFVDVIDPVHLNVLAKIRLPDACTNPHGMVVDSEQEIAFVVCADADKVVRVNLRTLKPFPDATLQQTLEGCDIARLDHPLHILFIGCGAGIVMFNEANGQFTSLGAQFIGGNSHTILIDEQTQKVYVPIANVSNRPILRILQYVPNGTDPLPT